MGEAPAQTTRGSRDRLKGQPQECQHSAAEGGTRDRLPPASDSRATSQRIGINFASCDIVSMLRMSTHGVRMFTEPVFREDDDNMAKKAKKAKKTAKAATKKVAKKTKKKK